ncbi:4Fe-4S ferredoxin N-terminal domain-containing protein [Natronoarchaeum sp. GCM10025703]|uniref:4Fe-4S ferredoxin N-terminal domain-containing protein n=1 Tax=unclassified Natronoarchaeum TaxID=2620183 RepID=UPI00361C99CF
MGNETDRLTEEEAHGVDADDWEQASEEILADSSADADLGKRMSRDAVRVSIGEMSEAEFHEKYHEEILEEFGVDERPTDPEVTNE